MIKPTLSENFTHLKERALKAHEQAKVIEPKRIVSSQLTSKVPKTTIFWSRNKS